MNYHKFDTVVVGSGTSAYYAVDTLNKAGQKVAIVDERPYGGTCALRGCQPKKYLVSNAEAVAMASHLVGRGIVAAPKTDWHSLQTLKNAFLDGRSEVEVKNWQKAGVATFHGRAVMTGEDEITVGHDQLKAQHIVLAAGATPRRTNIPGAEHVCDSEHFLNLPNLPDRIVFVGGGYISFEFAHIAIRAGAEKVTILHRSSRPLKAFDQDIVKNVLKAGKADGIRVVLNESPKSVESTGKELIIKGSQNAVYKADLIIEATGRIPNLSVLQGDHGKVEHSSRGVIVNEFLQNVSNPRVYAVGDCAATKYMLAPVADEEGKTAAHNILQGNIKTIDYSAIPRVVFTIPSIGSVGLTEEKAKQRKLDFRVNQGMTTRWPSSKRIGEEHGSYKIIIDNKTDQILGAHIARHNSSEAINVLALAMKHKIKASELAEFMWAYPTVTSDLKYMLK
ncbi:MAG: NAD(P)/FAD-dependent oxidoreductase [Desulfobacterales bacterium]|nr:NAD(P)/FAD-dependent oxidoreductase [Desulfobacterales bacterium]